MKTSYVLNPLFVLVLCLLLLNDFVLKSALSNFLTGKLSDLAGIVVLVLFLSVFFPKRKLGVYVFVVLAFTFWKSPLSSPFIAFLNEQFSAGYSRVVDFSDLFCLLVLIPLYRFQPEEKQNTLKPVFIPLSGLTLFALVATSRAQPEQYGHVYIGKEVTVKSSKENFFNTLSARNIPYKITNKYVYKGDSVFNCELQKFLIGSDTIYGGFISITQEKPNRLTVHIQDIYFTERGKPAHNVNYASEDSIAKIYRSRTVHYFENLKQN